MDFKIPSAPSTSSYIEEIADFWELQAIIQSNRPISKVNIIKRLSVASDEEQIDGLESEEDELDIKLDLVLPEFSKRRRFCTDTKYPFTSNLTSIKILQDDSWFKYSYIFLLLCTRLNMKSSSIHADIDGTFLFEKLCRVVGENYFGNLSQSFHFGTGNPGDFPDKVQTLIEQMEEGRRYKNINDHRNLKNDDGVDVVFWKSFSDREESKLIGFGQCKTGTSWHDSINNLKPKSFCKKWFLQEPFLDPIPIIFIADTLKVERGAREHKMDRLFFNRFRIIDFVPDDIEEGLENEIRTWVEAALEYTMEEYS